MKRKYPRTGLAQHGTTVAMTPSRAITSHLRHRYHSRYKGTYRFARALFLIDLCLLAIAVSLSVATIVFFLSPIRPPVALRLDMVTKPLVSGDVVPLEASVRATDEMAHLNVHLAWLLPPWVEVLRADPPLRNGRFVDFDRVTQARPSISRLYVRIRATPGTSVPFAFRVSEGDAGNERVLAGTESRTVASSAIVAEPFAEPASAIPGGSIPIVLENRGTVSAPAVIVRLVTKDNAPQSTFGENGDVRVGELLPHERRVLFLTVDPDARGTAEYAWEVQDAARPMSVTKLNVPIAESVDLSIRDPRVSPNKDEATVAYHATRNGGIVIVHPGIATSTRPIQAFAVVAGNGIVRVPIEKNIQTKEPVWSAIPTEKQNGRTVFGRRISSALRVPLPFSAAARYYSVSGDQIGVGPLPPKVGEPTTYWIAWTIGPTVTPFRDLLLSTTLAPNVTASGKYAGSADGAFTIDGSTIHWTILELPPTGASPSTFAFEISYLPTEADRGVAHPLILESSASATEVSSSSTFSATALMQNTNLSADEMATGKGRVE